MQMIFSRSFFAYTPPYMVNLVKYRHYHGVNEFSHEANALKLQENLVRIFSMFSVSHLLSLPTTLGDPLS